MTDTSREAVETLARHLIDDAKIYNSPEMTGLCAQMAVASKALRALIAERDALEAKLAGAREALHIMATNTENMRRAADCHKLAATTLNKIGEQDDQ